MFCRSECKIDSIFLRISLSDVITNLFHILKKFCFIIGDRYDVINVCLNNLFPVWFSFFLRFPLCIGFSFSIFLVKFQWWQSIPFADSICNRLNLFFPVSIYVSVFITSHAVYRIKYNMSMHMMLIIMYGKHIIEVISQIFFAEFLYYLICCLFLYLAWFKTDHKMISLPSFQFIPIYLRIHHVLINFF